MEVFGTPRGKLQTVRCVVTAEVNPGVKVNWWVAVLEPGLSGDASADTKAHDVQCGLDLRPPVETTTPSLTSRVVVYTFPYGERLLGLDIVASGETVSGKATTDASIPRELTFRRQVFIEDGFRAGGSVVVPALGVTEPDRELIGFDELLVKISVKPSNEAGAAYGIVSVASDMIGADLMLDGGSVGRIPSDGKATLPNVRAGERELRASDRSGRQVVKRVEVVKNRHMHVLLSDARLMPDANRYRLVPMGKNAQGYEQLRRDRDGAVVVAIPAGEFLMGNKNAERTPFEHRVELSEFLIDRSPVTWAQYITFAQATETPLPPDEPYWGMHTDHPAVFVTWEEATSYCEWVGGRLPTEAEREKAARGTDERKYPWGNEEPDPERAVFRRAWGGVATDPVGTHPKGNSPYGLTDMGGNVWEWVSDLYDDKYYEVGPRRDPRGPETGRAKVVRGGSWDSRPSVTSASVRNWGYRGYREGDFGFRCAMSPRPSAAQSR
jgi:formylglycine-generating enzyme required for sulfatase activity